MKASLSISRVLTVALVAALFVLCDFPASAYDVSRLIIEGKRLHDAGKTAEAEAIWRTALELDPANKAARGLLADLGAQTGRLHTRWFKIDPATFVQGVQRVAEMNFGTSGRLRSRPVEPHPTNASGGEAAVVLIRDYFKTAGVELNPPKSIVFNDRSGLLMVRATLPDLDLIEQAVQVMNMIPPQVMIDVKICEVPEESAKALGFTGLLGPAEARSLARVTNPPGTNSPGNRLADRKTNSALSGVTGILTPQQYAAALRALEQRDDVTFIAAPRVLTPSGRQAQIKTVDTRSIVTGLDLSTNLPPEPGQPPQHPPISEPFELGPVVDIVPYVLADGRSIQMTVIPSVREFVGYDLDHPAHREIWQIVEPPASGTPSQLDVVPLKPRSLGVESSAPRRQPYPLPVFRLRQMVSTATVWDRQTLVLYTHQSKLTVPDGHPALKLQMAIYEQVLAQFSAVKKVPSKALLVFVTPRIVDRTGNAVHTDAEISTRTNYVPLQAPR